MAKVLVMDNIAKKGVQMIKEAGLEADEKEGLSEEQLVQSVSGYDAMIVRSATKVTPKIIAAAGKMKAISRAGVGLDNVDIQAATAKGIFVFNTPEGNTVAVAEHAIGLMIALNRHIAKADASMKRGEWEKKAFKGNEIQGKTLGLIGFGRIGREVAKRAHAFGMKIIVADPFAKEEHVREANASLVQLEELLAQSDIISLHVPLTEQTKGMINADTISKMKDGAKIVNTARGGAINEADLVEALKSGKLGGAGLDVFAKEPLENSELTQLGNVILTPHIASATKEAQDKCGVEAAQQIIRALKENNTYGAVNYQALAAGKQ